jgi:hypothetical protein
MQIKTCLLVSQDQLAQSGLPLMGRFSTNGDEVDLKVCDNL